MAPTTTSRPTTEPTRTASDTFKTPGAPSNRHFEQMILPGIGSDFLIPRGLIRYLRRLFRRPGRPGRPTPTH